MKKIIIIAFLLILVSAAGFFFYQKYDENKEKGKIDTVDFTKEYTEISQYAYCGKINFRNFYLVFRPLTDDNTEVGSRYECAIIEDYGEGYGGPTYFEVTINGEAVNFKYTSGENEFYLEGTYNGELTINNEPMSKVNIDEMPVYVYGMGTPPPATPGVE